MSLFRDTHHGIVEPPRAKTHQKRMEQRLVDGRLRSAGRTAIREDHVIRLGGGFNTPSVFHVYQKIISIFPPLFRADSIPYVPFQRMNTHACTR